MAVHTLTGRLYPTAPFDFVPALRFLNAFRPMMGQQDINQAHLTKALRLDNLILVFTLESSGTTDHPNLNYTIWSETALTAEIRSQAEAEICFYLSLEDDLRPFYRLAENDPQFMSIVRKLYGYHQVKFSLSAFENACWALLSQRNQMNVALAMKARLTSEYGDRIKVAGKDYYTFPAAAHLASLDFNELNSVIRNIRKTECVLSAAQAFATIDEAWLRQATYEQAKSWLLEIKGIGAWSASFILLRGLGHMENLPVDEKAILNAARRVYGRDDFTQRDVQTLGWQYGAYAGYWAHYLRVGG